MDSNFGQKADFVVGDIIEPLSTTSGSETSEARISRSTHRLASNGAQSVPMWLFTIGWEWLISDVEPLCAFIATCTTPVVAFCLRIMTWTILFNF